MWGSIILPYIIQRVNKAYFSLSECLSPFQSEEASGYLADEERECVKLCNEYSDRTLFKVFSREATVKDFLACVTKEKTDKYIRPYIERRINKILTTARDEAIPCFSRTSGTDTLHDSDQLHFCGDAVLPVFRFDRINEQVFYSLNIEAEDKIVELREKPGEILCISPCMVRIKDRIFFISDIDGLKLKPFLSKESILIPQQSELKYFSGFARSMVNRFKAEGSAIRIIISPPDKKALLKLENGFKGTPVLILQYQYTATKIYANDTDNSFTSFEIDSGIYVYRKQFRDYHWEAMCREKLEEMGFFADDDIHFYSYSQNSNPDAGDQYTLLEAVNRNYYEIIGSGFVLTSGLGRNYNLKSVSIEISSRIENDWFDLHAIIKIGEWEIPFIRFRRNILENIREYELPDGSIAILPESWFPEYRPLFEFGKIAGDSLIIHKQHFALLPGVMIEKEDEDHSKLKKLLNPEELQPINPSAGLTCEMRPYQVEGLNWMYWLQTSGLGGCLADDMGLGKTVQTIALLQYNIENLKPRSNPEVITAPTLFDPPPQRLTSLIIVPASLIYNWQNEIKRFAPGMKVFCYTGVNRKKALDLFHSFDIILSSYHTVRQDIELIIPFRFHYVILDESQVIKNPSSQLFRSVSRLSSDHRLVLTGTPVENSLTDLWTQMSFVNPGLLGTVEYFRREFSGPISRSKEEERELKLKRIVKPFILRRTKDMVASDLPPVSEQTIFCDMTEEQARIYGEEKSAVRNLLIRNKGSAQMKKTSIEILQGLTRLRQISNHPVLVDEEYIADSGKFETVIQDIDNVISEGHKILVFSSFVKHLNIFVNALSQRRISFSVLTGASTNREKIVKSFQDDPDRRVFLISIKAGGLGLNLTAADYVFILDPWWNPAAELQARNRAHRIGQDKNVFVNKYISTGTIEEKIIRLQENKSRLADSFVRSNNPLQDLDITQMLDLL
ncbi:MAG: DEAD/DEAH box helicase [Bacteroidales bacterium]|nr:DEAD/DEAH box helicase [Bacteroidales bacterium]